VNGYNCGTCKRNGMSGTAGVQCQFMIENRVIVQAMRYDTHPSSMHPCPHGAAIVASAIAGYRFYKLPHGEVHAFHEHDGIVFHSAWLYGGRTDWIADSGDFCTRCGLRTADVIQIAQLYEEGGRRADG
jgi:hypothetical protein